MALCRWSSSAWYIYEPCGSNSYTIRVEFFGNFTVPEIIRDYNHINRYAKDKGYGIIDRLELRAYLKLWAYSRMRKLSWKAYVRGLETLRGLRQLQYYVQDPYSYTPFLGKTGDLPSIVQVEKVLCNKALARYEARREEQLEEKRKFTESGLAKAMSESED